MFFPQLCTPGYGALGWECLCTGFTVGAHCRAGTDALSSLGLGLLSSGQGWWWCYPSRWCVTALRTGGSAHHHSVFPSGEMAPKSSVAKDSSWDSVAGPLPIKHTMGKLWVLSHLVKICTSNDHLSSRHIKLGWMKRFPKGCYLTSATHPFQSSSVASRLPRRR